MSAYTGRKVTRQAVSDLETGHKTFTVELLRVVSAVQRFPYSWYLDGPYNAAPPPEAGAGGSRYAGVAQQGLAEVIELRPRKRAARPIHPSSLSEAA